MNSRIRTGQLILLIAGLFASLSFGTAQACPMISCFDNCTGQVISGEGDGCSLNYDSNLQCWRNTPYCGSNDPLHCATGIHCSDRCDNQFHYFPNANTCSEYYDFGSNCYRAIGLCQ